MLVLTRKLQQQIRVGDNITITVLRVKGNTVRVGIEAPRDIRVVRGELPIHETSAEPAVAAQQEPACENGASAETTTSEVGGNAEEALTEPNRLLQMVRQRTVPFASASPAL